MRLALMITGAALGFLIAELALQSHLRSNGAPPADFAQSYRREILSSAYEGFGNYRPIPFPYFGFVGSGKQANNFGFTSSYPFPYQRQSDEYVIGLFGGSVAAYLFPYLDRPEFLDELRKRVPALKTRKVVLLNFAFQCYKQPQQFFVSSFFLETFDLSVNLDGYNEVLTFNPSEKVEFPCYAGAMYAPGARADELKRKIARTRRWALGFTRLLNSSSLLSRSAALFVAWSAATSKAKQSIHESLVELGDIVHGSGDTPPRFSTFTSRRGAKNWAKYTRLQSQLARANGKDALFLLQPNEHVTGSKPLSAEEEGFSRVFSGIAARKAAINAGYEQLHESLPRLKEAGVSVYDLTNAFSGIHETLYIDDCCHLNEEGNRLLRKKVLDALADHLKKRGPGPSPIAVNQ